MNKLISFVKQFTKKEIREIDSVEKINNKYFLVNKELKELKDRIDLEVFSAGLFIGELKNNKFMPSLALLEIISKHSDKKVFLNNKGETMFLYKRNVFEENIIKGKSKPEEGLVLIQNDKNENLGYGEIIIKGKKKILKNILDKGDYLRREQKRL